MILTIYQEMGGKDALHVFTVKLSSCHRAELIGKTALKVTLRGTSSCVTVQTALIHCLWNSTAQAFRLFSALERPCALKDGLLKCYLHVM